MEVMNITKDKEKGTTSSNSGASNPSPAAAFAQTQTAAARGGGGNTPRNNSKSISNGTGGRPGSKGDNLSHKDSNTNSQKPGISIKKSISELCTPQEGGEGSIVFHNIIKRGDSITSMESKYS